MLSGREETGDPSKAPLRDESPLIQRTAESAQVELMTRFEGRFREDRRASVVSDGQPSFAIAHRFVGRGLPHRYDDIG